MRIGVQVALVGKGQGFWTWSRSGPEAGQFIIQKLHEVQKSKLLIATTEYSEDKLWKTERKDAGLYKVHEHRPCKS